MPDIIQPESTFWSALLTISAFAPGFLISLLRQSFITGRLETISNRVFEYTLVSCIYYSVTLPIFLYIEIVNYLSILILFFVLPILTGAIFGVLYKKSALEPIWSWLGVGPVDPAPTSWDYVFNKARGRRGIIITLTDGRSIKGYYGINSFASSDLNHRDIFIEDVRGEHFEYIEEDKRVHSIWIKETEIAMIEFIES